MTTTTLERAAALAHALDAEARRLRHRAEAERKVGALSFPDDMPLAAAKATFGPLLSELNRYGRRRRA